VPATTEAEIVDARDAERLVVRAVAAAVVFVLAASTAIVLQRNGGEDGERGLPDGGATVFGSAGPTPGEDVPAYVARRQAALGRLDGRLVAVVSFDRYRRVADVVPLLRGTRVRAVLVAAPGGMPSAAQGSLRRWADDERRRALAERRELERLLLTTEDPDFLRQYHEDIARLTALARSVEGSGEIVFGAVVEAEAEALRGVARRSGVRLVDPVARRLPEELPALAGLRPEETVKAGDPRTRP
jgi:hypothetical protein